METRRNARIGVLRLGALAAAVLLAAASLAACGSSGGGSGGASPAAPRTIKVAPVAKMGFVADAAVGDTVVVSLDANPTTGFTWKFTGGDTFEIVSSKYVADPNPDGLAGAGGTQVVTLKVTKAGTSDLTATYRQQWNSPSPDAKPDFSMTIDSTG
jgi:inhibitor of cysteine peptidase